MEPRDVGFDFSKFFTRIEENQERKLKGEINSIYWEMPRLTDEFHYPGFIPSKYYMITANSHIGKTIFAKWLVNYSTYCRWIEYDKSFNWRILWFALEESKDEFWSSLAAVCIYLKYRNRFYLTPEIIHAQVKRPMTKEERTAVQEAQQHPFFKACQERVIVHDDILNPTGIKKEVDKHFLDRDVGTWDAHDNKVYNYRLKPNHYFFVVNDNTNLLQEEKNSSTGALMTKSQTMEFYSGVYALNVFCKRYGAINVDIQQQSADSEAKLYTNRGEVIESKLEPTLADLGDSKKTARNAHVVLGLFDPIRHDITRIGSSGKSFNIDIPSLNYGRKFRRLIFLKDRIGGRAGSKINMYCEGYVPYFKEMLSSEQYAQNPELLSNILETKLF
jgi:hypothetical protein